jgi:hypothetical protein
MERVLLMPTVRSESTLAAFSRSTKPADLPVVQASKFGLVINRRRHGQAEYPGGLALLVTADEVIE